jgi:Peptidase family M23
MKPKTLLIILISIFLLIPLAATTSHATVDVVCFEGEFIRGAGKPITELRTFPGISSPATVKLWNGGAQDSDTERVSSSTVTLNGNVIFGPSNFNQNVTHLEETVILNEGDNNLEVLLKSKPGGKIRVEISHEVDADAAAYIGSAGGEVFTPDGCSANIPAGALSDNTLITITSLSKTPDQIGSIYEFGPPGTSFSQLVTLTVPYDPALMPSNVLEEDLFLASIDDYIKILEDIQIDTINYRVSGKTLSFSHYALAAYYFTGVNISDFSSVATSFRMPIGDNGIEDLGNDLNLLNRSNWTEFNYPKISFNLSEVSNNWYVATAFNKDRWLNNDWADPSPAEDDVYGCDSPLSSIYSCSGFFHPGEDWNMLDQDDFGKPIHAIADGIVLLSQNQGKRNSDGTWTSNNFGNIIIIGHKLENGETIASIYGHMQDKSSYEPGDVISKGDEIGLIGTSGGVASHLHFEITKGNNVLLKIEQNGDIKVPAIDSENLIKGWYWPGTDTVFINDNYHDPSYFIQEHQPPQLFPPIPTKVISDISYAQNPDVTVDNNNNIYTVWNVPYTAIMLQRSTDRGETFSPSVEVSGTPDNSGQAQIAADNANINIVWVNEVLSPTYSAEIFFRRSTDQGVTFTNPKNISNTPTVSVYPAISTNNSGVIAIVWQDDITDFSTARTFFTISTDNGQSFQPYKQISDIPALYPRVSIDSNNNIYVVWQQEVSGSYDEIYFTRSTDNGQTFTSPINISNTPAVQSQPPDIATDKNGNINIVWGDYLDIVFTRSTDQGQTFTSPQIIPLSYGGWPKIETVDSDIYITWISGPAGVYFSQSVDEGQTFTPAEPFTQIGQSSYHALAVDSDHNIHVVCSSVAGGTVQVYYTRAQK